MSVMRVGDDPNTVLPLSPELEMLRSYWALNHAVERTSKRMSARLGVTAEQRMVLRVIGRAPGIGPGALAQLLHLDASTVSATLRQLTARRLVTRRKHAPDARRVELHLAAKGRTLDAVDEQTMEGVIAKLLASTPQAEVDAVRGFLGRLADALDGIDAAPDVSER